MLPLLTHRRWLVAYGVAWWVLGVVPAVHLAADNVRAAPALFVLTLPVTFAFGLTTVPLGFAFGTLRRVRWQAALLGHGLLACVWTAGFGGVLWAWAQVLGQGAALQGQWATLAVLGALFYGAAWLMQAWAVALAQEHKAAVRQAELATQAREATLQTLQAQVHPHFLFNSLHAVSALITQDPAAARRMCIQLADLLRQSLRFGELRWVSFAEELALAMTYLEIERVRLGARLQVQQDVQAACNSWRVPPLVLQPLVENAILHGIALMSQTGTVRVEGQCHDGILHVTVRNPLDPQARSMRRSSGLGLVNLRRRLHTVFGERAWLHVERQPEAYCVRLGIPMETPP